MKSQFLTDLVVKQIDDKTWALEANLEYNSALLDDLLIAPKGFITDFASIPRVPIAYTLFGNRAHRESVIHDYLYQTHLATKAMADKVFLEAMEARGKSFWVRWVMYLGVRVGGGSAYKTGKERFKLLNQGA